MLGFSHDILHREPVGGRNCFLGHGVTYRVAEQATASARLQMRKRVWSLTFGSCLPAGAKVFGFTQICVKVNCVNAAVNLYTNLCN